MTHKLECALFGGEDFCDCGGLDVAELINWHADLAGPKPNRRAA